MYRCLNLGHHENVGKAEQNKSKTWRVYIKVIGIAVYALLDDSPFSELVEAVNELLFAQRSVRGIMDYPITPSGLWSELRYTKQRCWQTASDMQNMCSIWFDPLCGDTIRIL